MAKKKGRKKSKEREETSSYIQKLICKEPRYRKTLPKKVQNFLANKGYIVSQAKATDLTNKAYTDLVRQGDIKKKKVGNTTLWYAPHLEEKANEILLKAQGLHEEEFVLPATCFPDICRCLEEFPVIDSYDFGVTHKKMVQGTINKGTHKFIMNNLDKAIYWVIDESISLPFCSNQEEAQEENSKKNLLGFTVEFSPNNYQAMLKQNKKLEGYWNLFLAKSTGLYRAINELNNILITTLRKEFSLPMSSHVCFLQDTLCYDLVSFFRFLLYQSMSGTTKHLGVMDINPQIYGINIAKREIIFCTPSFYMLSGESYIRVKPGQYGALKQEERKKKALYGKPYCLQYYKVKGCNIKEEKVKGYTIKEKKTNKYYKNFRVRKNSNIDPNIYVDDRGCTDAFIFFIGTDIPVACLSRLWVRQHLLLHSETIDAEVKAIDNFCITNLNNALTKIHEYDFLDMAHKLYNDKIEVVQLHDIIKTGLKKAKYNMEFGS